MNIDNQNIKIVDLSEDMDDDDEDSTHQQYYHLNIDLERIIIRNEKEEWI